MNQGKSGELPLVSICIPTCNRAGMVGNAIRSALAQTYPAIEVLVVDNASTDETGGVVSSFTDPRLRYIVNEENLGLFGNFNRCIALAKGDIVHILHSDDTVPPGFTQTCVDLLLAHPEVAMTFTPARIMGEGIPWATPQAGHRIYHPPEGFRAILRDRGLIACPSVMVRKEVFAEIGPFSTEYPYSSDLYQWLRIARGHAIARVEGTHVSYRQGTHTESYRLLFESPLGYVDTAGILARVAGELGSDRDHFAPDMNIAATRFVGDCLYALCTRGKGMQGSGPSLLPGVARSVLGLVRPRSFREKAGKAFLFLAILFSPVCCAIPGIGSLILALLGKKEVSY
jgi:hypothetical protein